MLLGSPTQSKVGKVQQSVSQAVSGELAASNLGLGLGSRVQELGFRVWDLGFMVQGLGLRVTLTHKAYSPKSVA